MFVTLTESRTGEQKLVAISQIVYATPSSREKGCHLVLAKGDLWVEESMEEIEARTSKAQIRLAAKSAVAGMLAAQKALDEEDGEDGAGS